MSPLLTLFTALLLVPLRSAVRCYNGAQGVYINNPRSLAIIDCGNAINTCSKTVDLSAQIANRACGPAYTCLYQNGTSSPRGFCFNVSTAQTSCCCYGSLCNDSTRPYINTAFLLTPLLALFCYRVRKMIT
ncbi:unnamed protein product [Bursaphelenchus xylophilus]|uniref:(pine wood nematode) hypothetical protein n=1 Tax=Bursaphelenchus xylophilus TaxID=6326 RepID=A0A1I7SUR5_BURXY|nr:unnamed protein product [Bursaphelenchus xylophilus]CAG9125923.1 unnamed protein product [Bursaphelenchus xylophilus]